MHYVWGVLVVLIALFFLYVTISMFREKKSKGGKIFGVIVTIIMGGWGLSLLGVKPSSPPAPTSSTKVTSTTTTKTLQTKQTSTPTKIQQAKQAVQTFDKFGNEFQDALNQYQNIISGVSNGTLDVADAYTDLQNLQQQTLLTTFSDAETLNVPSDYSSDKEELSIATSYLQSSMGELKNYLNDQQVKELASAKSDLQNAIEGEENATMAIAATAIKNGYNPPSNSTK